MEEKKILPDLAEEIQPEEATNSGDAVLKKPQGRKKRWIVAAVLAVAVMLSACAIWFFVGSQLTLEILLDGDSEILLEYGNTYQEPGFQIILRGTWFLKDGITPEKVSIESQTDLQENKPGKYTVTYYAQYNGWEASARRIVRVVDTENPVITLTETGKTILPGRVYEEEGYIAVDNYDGDITHRVQRTEELGVITYVVMDSSGNMAAVERKIPYYDPLPPEIQLEGGEIMTIAAGTVWAEPGFQASDNADGDISDKVTVDGEVIWYQPGVYEISYLVSDTYGNVTQAIRSVEVTAQPRPETKYPKGKAIYLTFDDGPGPCTGELLDLLRRYGVKATFFVTDSGYDGTMWRIADEGHSIGIHTMTHDYNTIYASEEAFFQDLLGMQDIIYRNTGIRTTLMRFPGGGSNLVSRYNEGIMTRLTEAVQDAGFQYFDWNVDSNDAGGARRSQTVSANVIDGVQKQRVSIVLQHDIHDFSVAAVEDIIIWGLNNGYSFLPLTESSPTMHHSVLN